MALKLFLSADVVERVLHIRLRSHRRLVIVVLEHRGRFLVGARARLLFDQDGVAVSLGRAHRTVHRRCLDAARPELGQVDARPRDHGRLLDLFGHLELFAELLDPVSGRQRLLRLDRRQVHAAFRFVGPPSKGDGRALARTRQRSLVELALSDRAVDAAREVGQVACTIVPQAVGRALDLR